MYESVYRTLLVHTSWSRPETKFCVESASIRGLEHLQIGINAPRARLYLSPCAFALCIPCSVPWFLLERLLWQDLRSLGQLLVNLLCASETLVDPDIVDLTRYGKVQTEVA